MARVYLEKAGLVRCEMKDFSDDGSRFKVYDLDGVYVTYLKADGQVYLSAHTDGVIDSTIASHHEELYKLYRKVGATFDEYNGVSENILDKDALEKWVSDVRYWLSVVKDFKYEKPVAYLNEIDNQYYGWYFREKGWSQTWTDKSFCKLNLSEVVIQKNFTVKKLVVAE